MKAICVDKIAKEGYQYKAVLHFQSASVNWQLKFMPATGT